METDVFVKQATVADLEVLASLFDAYRQFYGQSSALAAAREFLLDRFRHNQSVIFLAQDAAGEGAGFTQLFPSFSSVSMARTFVLNDLFVAVQSRRRGIASRLLDSAAQYGKAVGAIRLSLSTALSNTHAQALYNSNHWELDREFCVFHHKL